MTNSEVQFGELNLIFRFGKNSEFGCVQIEIKMKENKKRTPLSLKPLGYGF